MRHSILFVALASFCWLAIESRAGQSVAPGFLEGSLKVHVSRGAQLADGDEATAAKVNYPDYPLVVLRKDNKEEIARITADERGHYRIPLPPGDYLLEVKSSARKRDQKEQRSFKVISQQTARVDMEILPDLSVSGAPR